MLAYFGQDGNYGSATGLVVVDTSHFTEEDWEAIEYAADYYKGVTALQIAKGYGK